MRSLFELLTGESLPNRVTVVYPPVPDNSIAIVYVVIVQQDQ